MSTSGFITPETGAFANTSSLDSTPINYSQTGTLNMAPLVTEIQALRASNNALLAEVQALRVDQQAQTSAVIASDYDATDKAANKVVASVVKSTQDEIWAATSKVTIV